MSDLVTSRIFTDGERGITAAKLNDITASSVIQPAFYTAKPTASSLVAGDKMLALKSGAYVQSDFQTVIDSVGAALSSDTEIWNVRLRSFNAAGNPNFEVDQKNCGALVSGIASTALASDRWHMSAGNSAMRFSTQQQASNLTAPGTNFFITSSFQRVTLTTAQAALAAGDYAYLWQAVEGPMLRELLGDVHSISLFVRSSVANLKFGLNLLDNNSTHSLSKLCTLGAANTWTFLTFPSLPLWTAAGSFSTVPGAIGYYLGIVMAAGSTQTVSANDTWQVSGAIGAVGQSNYANSPVNSTFDVAFVQHEPGPVCSTLMDKPFSQNLDECLRYFCKSYNHSEKPGVASASSSPSLGVQYTPSVPQKFNGWIPFPKPMAKAPTVTAYNPASGAINSVTDFNAVSLVVSTIFSNEKGIDQIVTSTGSANSGIFFHYTADTGW